MRPTSRATCPLQCWTVGECGVGLHSLSHRPHNLCIEPNKLRRREHAAPCTGESVRERESESEQAAPCTGESVCERESESEQAAPCTGESVCVRERARASDRERERGTRPPHPKYSRSKLKSKRLNAPPEEMVKLPSRFDPLRRPDVAICLALCTGYEAYVTNCAAPPHAHPRSNTATMTQPDVARAPPEEFHMQTRIIYQLGFN